MTLKKKKNHGLSLGLAFSSSLQKPHRLRGGVCLVSLSAEGREPEHSLL